MELTQFIIPLFVALEVALILALYRYVLRDWIIQKWEEKMDEEGWLVIRLDPVINEIEDRMHDKLEQFQSSFFALARGGSPFSVGKYLSTSGSSMYLFSGNKYGVSFLYDDKLGSFKLVFSSDSNTVSCAKKGTS